MHYDVAVAGLGGMGSAILAQCALRGASAIGFDPGVAGHALGASSGRSRLIRKAYFEDPRYVPLLERAYVLWQELQKTTTEQILHITGLLIAGPEASPIVHGTKLSASHHGLCVEVLTSGEVTRRYPAFKIAANEIAVLEPEGGILVPEAAVRAQLAVAAANGGIARSGVSLKHWTATDAGCRLGLSDGSTIKARTLVLALGPWFKAELAAVGIPLRIQRNVQAWFAPANHVGHEHGLIPFVLDRIGLPAPLYGFPDLGDGIKAAFHCLGDLIDADQLDPTVHFDRDVKTLAAALAQWIPGGIEEFLTAKACMYSLTPDENFVIDRHPHHPNVVLCGGFSGHGFKFASVVGEIGADLALEGETRHDIEFLSTRRFRN